MLLGTGFRVDLARIGLLDDDLLGAVQRANGYPVLGRGLELRQCPACTSSAHRRRGASADHALRLGVVVQRPGPGFADCRRGETQAAQTRTTV